MGSSASNYWWNSYQTLFFFLLIFIFWISIFLSNGKVQSYKHSIYFLVMQFVCHVSKFMLGEIQTFGRKWGFQISFSVLVAKMCSLGPIPGLQRTPEWLTVNPDPSSLLLVSLLIFKTIQAKWLYLYYISLFLHL